MYISYLNKEITLDQKQQLLAAKLLLLSDYLRYNNNFWSNLFSHCKDADATSHNLYIYGDVGRGKTMLVKNFYDSQKTNRKIYFHFNDFINQIHKNLRDIRKEQKKYDDELIEAARRITVNNKLLCLDELQAIDIADAMMISRIFSFLFKQKIMIIFTSNCHPLELYADGIGKELFLEFVDNVLLKKCELFNLNGPIDYRAEIANQDLKSKQKNIDQLYFISSLENDSKIKDMIAAFTDHQPLIPKEIEVWQRKIIINRSYKNVAIIDFDELSLANLGASDYHQICQNFDLIFLLKVPDFNRQNNDQLRRFILLIDEIYESNAALIIEAAVAIDKLGAEILKIDNYLAKFYVKSNLNAFKRAISRLKEIGSLRYFQATKLFKKKI